MCSLRLPVVLEKPAVFCHVAEFFIRMLLDFNIVSRAVFQRNLDFLTIFFGKAFNIQRWLEVYCPFASLNLFNVIVKSHDQRIPVVFIVKRAGHLPCPKSRSVLILELAITGIICLESPWNINRICVARIDVRIIRKTEIIINRYLVAVS